MSDINKFNNFVGRIFERLPFAGLMDFKNKEENVFVQQLYMLDRTQSLFEYSGLPDSIPQRMLEIYLQVNGHCAIAEYEGTLYAFKGGLGGLPDAYYMPTVYTVANPYLNFEKNLKIGTDCVLINNDSMFIGLMPLFNRYASMIAETELSMQLAVINARIIDLIVAEDDATRESAEEFLEKIAAGNLGVIGSNAFLSGLKTLPYASASHSNQITQLIEMEQYAKAAWYNEIGLNANYNMKREALSSAESQLNNDALMPLIDDMLRCRRIAIEKINEKYGLEITVELGSSWKDNELETVFELETMKNASDPEEKPAEDPEEKPAEDPDTPEEKEGE